MKPEQKLGYVVGEHLEVNNALELLDEAKTILEDQNVRATMKANSYLGELSELSCYNQALEKAQNGLNILQKYHKDEDIHISIVDSINKKIEEMTKPVEPEPEEPVVAEHKPVKKKVIPELYSGVPGGEVIEPEDKPKKTKRKRSRKKVK